MSDLMKERVKNEIFIEAPGLHINDYVQVVRCKDCQYGGTIQEGFIPCEHDIGTFDSIIHEPNWFCADGKRRF